MERSSFLVFISAVIGGSSISSGNLGVGGTGSKLEILFVSAAESDVTPLVAIGGGSIGFPLSLRYSYYQPHTI